MTRYRRVEKQVDGGEFFPAEFDDLRAGDRFRLFDDTQPGDPPAVEDGSVIHTALTDAQEQPDGNSWVKVVA